MASFVLVAFKNTIDYANNIQLQLNDFGFESVIDADFDKTLDERQNNYKNKIIIILNTKNYLENTIELCFNDENKPFCTTLENMINLFIV
jgi:hypothetical protein